MTAKLAVVTAGSRGLGGAISSHLASQGHKVVVHYFQGQKELEDLKFRYPNQIIGLSADMTDEQHRQRFVQELISYGTPDILVNNLGIYPEKNLWQIDSNEFGDIITLNCLVVFELCKKLSALMIEANERDKYIKPRQIVNIGDSGADRITAHFLATPYHISKLGVNVLTRTFAQQLGAHGITVNMLSPGFLENSVGEAEEAIPAGAPTRFEDILRALDFLLDDNNKHVSGANLVVSGAWNLG